MADVSSPPEYANTTSGPVLCLCIWVNKNTCPQIRCARVGVRCLVPGALTPGTYPRPPELERPTRAIARFDVLLGNSRREHGPGLRIHVDRLRGAHREIAEQD